MAGGPDQQSDTQVKMPKADDTSTGFALVNRLRAARAKYDLSLAAQVLYYELVALSGNVANPVNASNGTLTSALRVSENTLITARKELINANLISFAPGASRRAASTYSFDIKQGDDAPVQSIQRKKGVVFIYLMHNKRNGYYKIGRAADPAYRERTLQSEEPEVELVLQFQGTAKEEKKLHDHYDKQRVRGEWFALTERDVNTLKVIAASRKKQMPPAANT